MFDFNVFNSEKAADEGSTLHLTHPVTGDFVYIDDKQTKPVTINLKGSDSKVFREAAQKMASQQRGKKGAEVDADVAIRSAADVYARVTTGWQNIYHDGKEFEFNYKNAVHLYITYKEIRIQVGDFIADKANFIKG